MAKRKEKKPEYVLYVTYKASHYFTPSNPEPVLNRTVGRSSDGGGMGFGERDLDWSFKTEKAATKALDRVKRVMKLRRQWCRAKVEPMLF